MKILLINKFLYPRGGDATITLATGRLLSTRGHKVVFWGMEHPSNAHFPNEHLFVSNIDYQNHRSIKRQVEIAGKIFYSFEARRKIEKIIKLEKPDIAHVCNIAHQISPSIFHALRKDNIPIVMTMMDYKLICPTYQMLQGGGLCEECNNRKYYHCFFNRCTKKSYSASLVNTIEMYLHHSIMNIYDLVDIYIALSNFSKLKTEEMGLKGKIVHLPNFINTEDFEPQFNWSERSIVYYGRLSQEKGVHTLLEAVKGLNVTLKIIGDGPIRGELEKIAQVNNIENVQFLGHKSGEELKNEVRKSMFSVIPSIWYEVFGMVIIESYALGKPVIGSRIGGIAELIIDNRTGFTFEPGNVFDLRTKILYLLENPSEIVRMGENARRCAVEVYGADKHYEELMKLYTQLIN